MAKHLWNAKKFNILTLRWVLGVYDNTRTQRPEGAAYYGTEDRLMERLLYMAYALERRRQGGSGRKMPGTNERRAVAVDNPRTLARAKNVSEYLAAARKIVAAAWHLPEAAGLRADFCALARTHPDNCPPPGVLHDMLLDRGMDRAVFFLPK